ncbi:hypothetical protein DFH29DRAFT_960284, partial [Suillus ampliporus]
AYSRALDRAFGWLIESGSLRAFNVVPSSSSNGRSCRATYSDVGSAWREHLADGAFGT